MRLFLCLGILQYPHSEPLGSLQLVYPSMASLPDILRPYTPQQAPSTGKLQESRMQF